MKIGPLAKAIKMCPAVMLAHNRTDSVIGRISCLVVSIIVMNCERGRGVDRGTMCLRNCLVLKKKENIAKPSQRGKASDKVNNIWLVTVYTYGIRPVKLKVKIKTKIEINQRTLNLLLGLFKEALSSLNMSLFTFSIVIFCRVDISQKVKNTGLIMGRKKIVKLLPNRLIKGSKDSNKLFIIFMF
jgi:hypothetical protein